VKITDAIEPLAAPGISPEPSCNAPEGRSFFFVDTRNQIVQNGPYDYAASPLSEQ
jgi:hypothetical protein